MKKKSVFQKCLIFSFIVHIIASIVFIILTDDHTIHKKFIVWGVHSQKPAHALFKPINKPVPFVGDKKRTIASRKERVQARARARALKRKREEEKKKRAKAAKEEKQKAKKKKKDKKKRALKKSTPKKKKPESKKKPFETPASRALRANGEKKKIKKRKNKKAKEKPKKVEKKKEPEEPFDTPKKATQDERATQDQAGKTFEKQEEELLEFALYEPSDPRLKKLQRYIQVEVLRLWRPPIGISKGTECTVSFFINRQGLVQEFEFVKRSNVLIYDLSISRVARQFKFDKCLWGKKFTIDFRQ